MVSLISKDFFKNIKIENKIKFVQKIIFYCSKGRVFEAL